MQRVGQEHVVRADRIGPQGESSLIGQAVAIGEGRRYVTALITLDAEALPAYAERLGISDRAIDDLVASPEIEAEVASAVERGNKRLHSNEQIKKFRILALAWVPDSDEITPTDKVKRRVINTTCA